MEVDLAADPLPGQALYEVLARCREEGDVVPARFLGAPAWAIVGYEALAAAFRDAERFPPPLMYRATIERAIGRSFISMDDPEHLVHRRLATPAFRSSAVARYERSGLEALAHELLDDFASAGAADLVAHFTERYPYLVITRLLGLPREGEAHFHRWAIGMLRYPWDPDTARACVEEFTRVLAPIVKARRREPRDDVISGLVTGEVDGERLSDEEIFATARLLFPTGGETTHGALGNLLYGILVHDGWWERLGAEPGLIPAVVEESLRWETSVAVLPRLSAPHPVAFHGAEIPPSSWVLFAVAAANRDPRVFPDPDRFDPGRHGEPMLTFGPGHKSCPGMHLARTNMVVALEVLTKRLPRLRLLDGDAAAPRGVAPRGPEALHVAIG
jgi:cytochrome P450